MIVWKSALFVQRICNIHISRANFEGFYYAQYKENHDKLTRKRLFFKLHYVCTYEIEVVLVMTSPKHAMLLDITHSF